MQDNFYLEIYKHTLKKKKKKIARTSIKLLALASVVAES